MTEQAQQAPEGASIGLADISAMVQVIDVVVKRGAINGDEMVPVGTLRQKLVDFLKEAQAQGNEVEIPQADDSPAAEESGE
jgi:hypothetical protein